MVYTGREKGMQKKRIWQLKKTDTRLAASFAEELGIAHPVAHILVSRGITTVDEAHVFLHASLEDLQKPQEISGIEAGTRRIIDAVTEKEKILVYGDYDVDGITSTSLLVGVLCELGGNVTYYIPDRVNEGYGLNMAAVESLVKEGVSLLVTVDCGISSREEVRYAQENGMDVIITDHHQAPELLPEAVTVIDPSMVAEQSPWKDLAGVGVAYKLAESVAASFGREDLCGKNLDLVALGTVADVVPLTGENRILVKEGLKVLARAERPGVEALLKVSGMAGKEITAGRIGYVLAPRINACGRLSKAELGVELLLTENHERALELAGIMEEENRNRQGLEIEIFEEAVAIIEDNVNLPEAKVLVVAKEGWHPGVIGIVASRLVDKYYRPVVMIALEEEIGRGSARSIPGFHLYEALESADEHLLNYGGHEMAAGLSIAREKVPSLLTALNDRATKVLQPRDFVPLLRADVEISAGEITSGLVEEIEALAPFGQGNPGPLLILRRCKLTECRGVGNDGKHLKMRFLHGDTPLDGIMFQAAEKKEAIVSWEYCDVAFVPEINSWQGRVQVQLNVKDIKQSGEPDDPFLPLSFLEKLYLEGGIWLEDDCLKDVVDREEFFTKVVGVTFAKRQEVIRGIEDGESVRIEREPENPNDPKALAVYYGDHHIGYLNAELAKILAPELEEGKEYEAYVTRVIGREKDKLGVRLCVRKAKKTETDESFERVKEELAALSAREVEEAVKKAILGEYEYHEKQREAIEGLKNGDNSLVIFATGRGKSAVFQTMAALQALLKGKMTIVVYPLRSLVNDQLGHFCNKVAGLGVSVAAVNGSMSAEDKEKFFLKMLQGKVDVVLTTTEFLDCHFDKFSAVAERIGLFVVDEAHHLGKAKRKGYRLLAGNWRKLGKPLALAVTATADELVAKRIKEDLECTKVIIEDYKRNNLALIDRREEKDKLAYLLKLVSAGERTVVYVNSRRQAFSLASELRLYYPLAREEIGFYHGGLSSEHRREMEKLFRQGVLKVLVTTSAFGEGIDIPDIKHVALYHLCFSRTEFNQLAGRAGRNGQKACVHVLFGEKDRKLNEFILSGTVPSRDVLGKVYLLLRDKARKENPFELTNYQIAEELQKAGANSFREQTASSCLAIFEELGLILREVEGGRRHLHFAPPPPGKLELEESVRYAEGLQEWEEFREFAECVLNEESNIIMECFNNPIYPLDMVE